jgi:hypothetical protein
MMPRRRRVDVVAVVICATSAVLGVAVPPAAAASSVDCNKGDLQHAISAASPGGTLLVKGTCVGTFVVDRDLTIRGNPTATLDAQQSGTTVAVNDVHTVHLASLEITGGWSENGAGGGVSVAGPLFLDHVTVTGNVSTAPGGTLACGGGVRGFAAPLHVTASRITDNAVRTKGSAVVEAGGGGVCSTGHGSLVVRGTTISGNRVAAISSGDQAEAFGGGVMVFDAGLSISSSHVDGNTAAGLGAGGPNSVARGGGVDQESSASTTSITGSTVSGNRVTVSTTSHSALGAAGGVNAYALTLTSSTVAGNQTTATGDTAAVVTGGGVHTISATVSRSKIISNTSRATEGHAQVVGGGIDSEMSLRLSSSTIAGNLSRATGHGNVADGWGGGTYGTDETITSSSITGNVLRSTSDVDSDALGGGVYTSGLHLVRSTVAGNTATAATQGGTTNATGQGGGVVVVTNGGGRSVENSTIANNHVNATASTSAGDAVAAGGGLFATGGQSLSVVATTVAGNSLAATGTTITIHGGGIGHDIPMTLTGDLVSLNATPKAAQGPNCGPGPVGSGGGNVLGVVTGCGFHAKGTDHTGVTNPKLGPLAANGGPTKTMALLAGSPAIDVISRAACHEALDQRGFHRPQGPRCDAGAYERTA